MLPLTRSPLRKAAALLLLGALTLSLCACPFSPSDVSRVADKAAGLARVVAAFDPAGQLLAERLITGAEAEAVRAKTSAFGGAVTSFADGVRAALDADPKADLIALLPAFATAVSTLNDLGALRLGSPKAQAVFDKILSGVRVSVAFISAFYAARVVAAESLLKRRPSEDTDRAALVAAGLTYDPARLARARADFKAAGLPRALSAYFGPEISRRDLALVSAAATWGT